MSQTTDVREADLTFRRRTTIQEAAQSGAWTRWISLFPALYALSYLGAATLEAGGPAGGIDYGASGYFLNYSFGFVKRGLLGTVLLPIPFISHQTIFLIESAITVLLIAMCYVAFARLWRGRFEERALFCFLLTGPAILPHFAYTSTQLDSVLFLLAAATAALVIHLPSVISLAGATLLTLAALAVHESYLLLFYPFVLAVLADLVLRRKVRGSFAVAHLAVVAGFFLVLVRFGKLKVAPAVMLAAAQKRTDRSIDPQQFEVMTHSLREQVLYVLGVYRHTPIIPMAVLALLLAAPYYWVLFSQLRRSCFLRGFSPRLTLVICAAFWLPPVLCFFGHDVVRWFAGTAVDATLFLLYLYSTSPVGSDLCIEQRSWTKSPGFLVIFVYCLILGPFRTMNVELLARPAHRIQSQIADKGPVKSATGTTAISPSPR